MAIALLKRAEKRLEAYAVARDFAAFPNLGKELDAELEQGWLPLGLEEAQAVIARALPESVQVLIIAVNADDESDLEPVLSVIKAAKAAARGVVLIANEVGPQSIHRLMRAGADDFAPFPLPGGALGESLSRLRVAAAEGQPAEPKRKRKGLILPVYGVAGGVGTTTFAVNLAWEMAEHGRKSNIRVALLDFNFQYGTVATYLDLPRREAIYELITDAGTIDHDSLAQALTSYKSRLAVLTAPADALPLDIISPEDVRKLLDIVSSAYDFVIVDMPQALVHWSDHALQMSETFFAVMEVDMRSAQNMMRFLRLLKSEELPWEKVQFILNRAPGFTDLNGKSRVKRMTDSLGIKIDIFLPDGGRTVMNACDQGVPLAEAAGGNALRREIRKIAATLVDMADARAAAIV